jgi:phosphatidylserine decarboxylase
MLKHFLPYFQYILPQHLLTKLAGKLADSRTPWLKNFLIKQFIKTYHVNLTEALIENPEAYDNFNQFFIRELKPGIRPIASAPNAIISPADGYIAQIGNIQKKQLLQAKNFYFDLGTLLGGDTQLADNFHDGTFATIYLAPHNYHRVHMPLDGKLVKTIYVPGKLFSVNRMTSEIIPNLYSRNERLICVFDTTLGPMTIVLVGAMIVGSIQTVWMKNPIRANRIITETFSDGIQLIKGAELGYFKLGSTVILLFGKDKILSQSTLTTTSTLQVGQQIF